MDTVLPGGVRPAPHPFDRPARKTKSRLRLRCGDRTIPVAKLWPGGFSVDRDQPQLMRGFIDLFDGARHIRHGLVYQIGQDAAYVSYAFKTTRDPRLAQPADFARAPAVPVGLLPRR